MRRDPGFTLVEVLAALVAGALLLVLLGWVVGGLAAELRATERHPEFAKLEAIAPALRHAIEPAIPPDRDGSGLAATPARFSVRVPPPQALGPIGPLLLELAADDRPDGAALIARLSPGMDGVRVPDPAAAERTIVDGLKAVRFSYIPRPPTTVPVLPRLVTITAETKDGRVYPISIEPKIDLPVDCQFDTISGTCRP